MRTAFLIFGFVSAAACLFFAWSILAAALDMRAEERHRRARHEALALLNDECEQ